ncbi:Vps51/Vps67 [Musa troglodytarum]|uniref:Conserved oligomeric Golgi complex subunit 1 n=1 Tax=Musa troglodytarum TaxID=320322 RepID=A0A9E7K1F1_9LILI|nr:Vps51/Vps67 [Musa troglodytarum]
MRSPPPPPAGGGAHDAESLFRSKPISEIRSVEAAMRREIKAKEEELRQLVGESYRDLIDSADSILLIRSSCESIDSNLAAIDAAVGSLSAPAAAPVLSPNPARARVYGIASRVKYLVDTPENIWGCLDESMLLEASGRYLRAKEVHGLFADDAADREVLAKFPLLRHQWQIVEGFKAQISQRSRERLTDQGLTVAAYADALAAAATIDNLDPKQVLGLFLDSRRLWISQKLAGSSLDPDSSSCLLCDVVRTIRSSLGQVGELFLLALNEMPLFYKMVLGTPPGTQLFGAIPHPEEEVRLWKSHREKLEAVMVLLEPEFIAQTCSLWLRNCCDEIFGVLAGGAYIIDAIASGRGLSTAEKLVCEALDDRGDLEDSLEQWLKSVFGSDIESPWNQIRGIILKGGKDILEDRLEEAFVKRMKEIVHSEFDNLSWDINLKNSIQAIVETTDPKEDQDDFQAYIKKPSAGGGIWFSEPIQKKTGLLYALKLTIYENDFQNSLNTYLGPEVTRIRDVVDNKCRSIIEDLICFVESHNSIIRLKELAPYLQEKCYNIISVLLKEIGDELAQLSTSLGSDKQENHSLPHSMLVERSLFLGRLLFALRNHSSYIPLVLGSPRQWVNDMTVVVSTSVPSSPLPVQSKVVFESPISSIPKRHTVDSSKSPRRQFLDNPRKQTISAAAALFALDDSTSPKLDELNKIFRELCIRAHSLWTLWVSKELGLILSKDLNRDDALSASTPLQIYTANVCMETLREAVKSGESHVSEKGILQILLDLKFIADVLSGGKDSTISSPELNATENSSRNVSLSPLRRKHPYVQSDSANVEAVTRLINSFSLRLDPIDWATYESYLWINEQQSYKRYAVLFGFLVQLNRMYTDTIQKLPTKSNTGSNIMRCSSVPRFKYLPISAPALSSRGAHKSALQAADDSTMRSSWKANTNGEQLSKLEFDDGTNFGVAAPLLKSIMTQVGSKFGESTSRWGSMLSDSQVGKLKDRSAAAMSTFGDILPGPAAGLLSSLTSGAAICVQLHWHVTGAAKVSILEDIGTSLGMFVVEIGPQRCIWSCIYVAPKGISRRVGTI